MKIFSPLEMNDWGVKSFLKTVLLIHLLMWSIIGIDALGIHVPVMMGIIGFIYLSIIPGYLLLRILRFHRLGSVRTLMFSVGLSVAFTMVIGLLVNTIYPLIGISRPLSQLSLLITFSVITLLLAFLSYIRDKDFSDPVYIEIGKILSPPVLFLFLLPLLSILGAFMVRNYQTNILLLAVIGIIAFTIVLIAFNRFIKKEFYPLAVFMIAVALLYYHQLSFPYLFGTDIQVEKYIYNSTMMNAYWTTTPFATTYSTMLSITILPAVWTNLLAIDGISVFKLIYPFLFSLVPLGLYEIYHKLAGNKTAFFAVFFFMSFIGFLGEMTYLMKVETASFFFVLLIILVLDKDLNIFGRAVLFMIFSFSLVVSHYGLAYYYLFFIIFAWLAVFITRRKDKERIRIETLSLTAIIFCIVLTISWYLYVSNGAVFQVTVTIGQFISQNISDVFTQQFQDPRIMQAMGLSKVGLIENSLLREIAGWFHRLTYFLIVIGIVRVLVKRREMRLVPEFIGMVIAGLIILAACIIIPGFSYAALNTQRIYFIALFFLSPFFIWGGETFFLSIRRIWRRANKEVADGGSLSRVAYICLILLVLIPYFLFNVGFIFEITSDAPGSAAISLERMKTSNEQLVKAGLYNSYMIGQDVAGIRWLSENRAETARVYTDRSAAYFLIPGYSTIELTSLEQLYRVTEIYEEAYLFFRYYNNSEGLIVALRPVRSSGAGMWMYLWGINNITPVLDKCSLIYSNGGSEIYYNSLEVENSD